MKIKTFNLMRLDSDDEINKFVAEHEKNIEQNGMYVFSDRIIFVYDDGSLQEKIDRVLHRSVKAELIETHGKQIHLNQRALEARRGAQAGHLKPDDVVRYENEKNAGDAKISYLQERFNELENAKAFEA